MSTPKTVLLVESNPADLDLFSRAFEHAGFRGKLRAVVSALQAEVYLLGSGIYQNRSVHPFPDLVLLDAGMPGQDVGLLRKSIQAIVTRGATVLLLAGPDLYKDLLLADDLEVTGYLKKPADFQEAVRLVRSLLL